MLRVEPELEALYVASGQVSLAYHPVLDLGQASLDGAVALECAARQQPAAYWPLRRSLFERQGELWNATTEFYGLAGESFGLDGAALSTCMAEPEIVAKITRLDQERRAAGIRQRPSFDINGRIVAGALPLPQFQTVIDGALAGQ